MISRGLALTSIRVSQAPSRGLVSKRTSKNASCCLVSDETSLGTVGTLPSDANPVTIIDCMLAFTLHTDINENITGSLKGYNNTIYNTTVFDTIQLHLKEYNKIEVDAKQHNCMHHHQRHAPRRKRCRFYVLPPS